MIIKDFYFRLVKRWWILVTVLVILILATLVYTKSGYSGTTTTAYKASISIGINSSEDLKDPKTVTFVPPKQQTVFSSYLEKRFASPEIQYKVADKMGISSSQDFNQILPFYGIISQDGGFVTLTYENLDKKMAEKFLVAVKEIYKEIVIVERNDSTTGIISVKPQAEFMEAVFPVTKSFGQSSYVYLPAVAIFLATIFVLLLIPIKKPKTK